MSQRLLPSSSWRRTRTYTHLISRLRSSHASFPTIQSAPYPRCPCAKTPDLPDGLEIDHDKPLSGTMAPYSEQVLICTGNRDWKSRIEEENGGDNLAADLKELLGRGGMYSDPYHNVSVTNSSLPPSIPQRTEIQTTSAYLFPSFKYVPFLPRVSFDSVQALVKGYILPTKLNPAHTSLSPIHKDRLLRSPEYQSLLYGVQDVDDILVLICGHGGRDGRCGVLGPVIEEEFNKVLPREGIVVSEGPVIIDQNDDGNTEVRQSPRSLRSLTARVGIISHIGGHNFAGNIIVYVPKKSKTITGEAHPLAGSGVWYGRVEPRHVEGIVTRTILRGEVFEDLFRGGITQHGEILRL